MTEFPHNPEPPPAEPASPPPAGRRILLLPLLISGLLAYWIGYHFPRDEVRLRAGSTVIAGTTLTWPRQSNAHLEPLCECPAGLTVEHDSGQIRWTPTPQQTGRYQLRFRRDTGRRRAVFDFHIRVLPTNHPPRFTTVPDTTFVVGMPYRASVEAVDDDHDAIEYRLIAAPPGLRFLADERALVWPQPAGDRHRLIIEAFDGTNRVRHTVFLAQDPES